MAHTVKVGKNRMPVEKGAINGGMMKRRGAVKTPTIAMEVKSINGTINKVLAHHGKVVVPKMEVMDMGWMAYVKDTEGNVIGVWQSKKKK
jgi:predicted enzyme related to lactoylglutathione lyase